MSDLSEWLMGAHLSWATWALHSLSLFWYEQPERFAHSRSFVFSDLSKLLSAAHLIWAKWANERMIKWAMSKRANSQPWFHQDCVSTVWFASGLLIYGLHSDLWLASGLWIFGLHQGCGSLVCSRIEDLWFASGCGSMVSTRVADLLLAPGLRINALGAVDLGL